MIYDEAEKLSYTKEQVQSMSPKEAIQLTCDLIARKMNYFGMTQDFRKKTQRAKEMQKMNATVSAVLNNENIPNDEKEKVQQKKRLIEEMEKKWGEIDEQERQLRRDAGYIAVPYDGVGVDKLFRDQEPIVCRQYAKIANGIFFVLKKKNQNLKNTRVCDYTDLNHRWNQVSTTYKKDDKTHIAISFFEPTWYDTDGHIEGYDDAHFPNSLLLTEQINRLQGEASIQPITRFRWRHFH